MRRAASSLPFPELEFGAADNNIYPNEDFQRVLARIAFDNEFANAGAKAYQLARGDDTDLGAESRNPLARALLYHLRGLNADAVDDYVRPRPHQVLDEASRNRLFTQPVDVAIDIHDWLNYGDSHTPHVSRTDPDRGTDCAYKVATICIVDPSVRFTLGWVALNGDHPVCFTNEGLRVDHKPENAIEWYVKIPHHEDYHLWMPAQPNPEQRDWLEALNAGDATMGESRLFERDGTWYLHLTATRDVEERSEVSAEERTPIGVDIGEASLVMVCHRDDHNSPTAPELWADEGKTVRQLRKTYFTATRRLQTHGSERIAESIGDDLWDQIDDVFHRVTREVMEYAESLKNPVLVLEDLTDIRASMDYGKYMNRRFHGWEFAKLHAQIRYKAVEKSIPVETVNPCNTSKECHACGEVRSPHDRRRSSVRTTLAG